QIANNPISINCPQHQNLDESLIVGEHCLKEFFSANSNLCPIELHSNCQYAKSKLTQRYIHELNITCPLQFEQGLEASNKNGIICTFNGKIKELNDHLNNSCPFNQSECWFKSFGCNHKCLKSKLETHLISNIKFHFDLVIKSFNGLKQNLGLLQEEAKQLKLQNEKLKLELQSKHNKDGEHFVSFKETLNKLLIEIEKLKKDTKSKMKTIQTKDDENSKMKETIQRHLQIIQVKEKQVLEKEDEIKKMQKQYQEEKMKMNSFMETIQTNFAEKEKQTLIHHEQLIKKLKEKNDKLTQGYENTIQQNDPIKKAQTQFDDRISSARRLIKSLNGHSGLVLSVTYSSFDDGRFLCSGSADKTIRVWDVKTATQMKILKGHLAYVNCVKFSPYHYYRDRRLLICSASDDKTIQFWDFETEKSIQLLSGHSHSIRSIQFSPFNNGRYLCFGSADDTICLRDVETYQVLYSMKGHTGGIFCVEFSPSKSNNSNTNTGIIGGNGYTICSGSSDKSIRLWDVETSKQLICFQGHENSVKSVKYSSYEPGMNERSGDTICSGSWDKTVRLWDVRSKKQIQIFNGHEKNVRLVLIICHVQV
ncbi:G-protein beta WD-40 repeats containing protein, partial [Reticulomyxa filosa]